MNKQDKEKAKALEIAMSLTDSGKPTLDRCVETGIQMAAWKERQMIEKAILFLRRHNCTIAATIGTEKAKQFIVEIEDFKKYMEEN